jgi:hypothetical protein
LKAKALSAHQIRLTWIDNTTAETNYLVEFSADGQTWTKIAVLGRNVKTYTHRRLVRRTTYYYRVRAMSTATAPSSYSAYSTVVAATTKRS